MTTDFKPWTPDQPMVTVTIAEPDNLDVKVFGVDYKSPPELQPLRRDSFGALMDHLYDRLRQPFTVEIIETDGSKQTGTIDLGEVRVQMPQPPAPTPPAPRRVAYSPVDPAWGPPEGEPYPRHRELPSVSEPDQPADTTTELSVPVRASGYVPGEEVCLACVVIAATAGPTGEVLFDLPRRLLDTLPTSEVIVYGRATRRATIHQPLLRR